MPLKIIPIEQVGVKKVEEQLPTDTPHDFDDDGNPIFDLQIDNWTMVNKNLPSMKLKFILLQRREMAIEVMAWPAMKAASRCNRCGREITHPASMLLGYGIDCVQRVGLGHEWIRACDTLTPLQILDIQNKARKEAAVRVWLPLSRCTINGVYGGLYWEITELLDAVSNVKAPPKIPFTMKLTVNQFRGAISRMIAITCPPAFGDQMKEIRDKYKGSHWNQDMKAWLFPFTRETSIELAKGYGAVCESIDQEILDLVEQHEQEQEAQINKSLNEFDPIPFAKVEPWLHQQRAYYFIRNLNAAMLAMEMGCIDGNAIVNINRGGNGTRVSLRTLYRKFNGISGKWDRDIPTYIRGLRGDQFGLTRIINVLDKGTRPVLRITAGDKELRLTPDHEVMTDDGWVRADELSIGDNVACARRNGDKDGIPTMPRRPHRVMRDGVEVRLDKDGYVRVYGTNHPRSTTGGVYEHILVMESAIGRRLQANEIVHHIDEVKHNNEPSNLEILDSQADHAALHADVTNIQSFIPKYNEITALAIDGNAHVYDVVCEGPHHNFVANGIVVHNCGKSAVVVHDIANDVDPATGKDGLFYIIVAPKTVVRGVWPNQFAVHTDKPITVMPLTKGTGFHKESEMLAAIGRAKQSGKKVVFIISYQSIYREPLGKFILGRHWDGIYLDESHKIKRPKGIASVFCGKLGKVARKRRILTGTPMPHSPLDIWSQYRALDSTIFGGSFTAFKSQYADYVNRGNYDQILGYINTNKLTEKVFSVAYRITKREALPNLPPVMFTERTVNLEPKARKLYDQMAKELIIMIEEGMISAANILVKLLRLQQIACGSVTDDDGVLRTVSTAKRDGLEEIMDDMPINKPLVVFCRFTHDLRVVRELCASQGRTYAELSGRSNQLADWQAGEYDVLGVQIQAGGVGIDLTRADTDIYYSVGYSLGDYEQALSRIDRPGQEMPVNHILLVAENTIDRRIYGALASKRDIQRGIMDTALELLRPMQGVTPIDNDNLDDEDSDDDEDGDDWGEK